MGAEGMRVQRTSPDPSWRQLHPRVQTLWWIKGAISDLISLGILSAAVSVAAANTTWTPPTWWQAVPAGVWVLLLVIRAWYVRAAYRRWKFQFDDDHLELRYGVLWRRTSSLPYHRLQQVDEAQGPLERWLGMARVQLRSAAATTDAAIPGIPTGDVAEIRRLLMQSAGHSDGI
jgi:membrane protein YdbS with pleckstrin-like domain